VEVSDSRARQFFVLLVLGVTAALSPVSIDMLAPSLPRLSQDIGASAARTELTIYAFLIGYGLAPAVWGRLSDSVGRRPVMFVGMLIYCLGSLACAYAESLWHLIVLRGIQGIGAAAGATMARAIVRDLYGATGTARGMATMISLMAVVPFFMPLLGGVVARQFSWEACFAAMMLLGFMAVSAYAILVPETRPTVDIHASPAPGRVASVIGNPVFAQHTLCNMFCIAVLVLFGANFSFILADAYGYGSAESGVALALFNGSIAAGTYLVWPLMPGLGAHRSILLGCTLCAVGWLVVGLQAYMGSTGIIGLAVAMVTACLGSGIVMSLCSGSALAPFSHNSGTASSIYLLVQSAGASGISYVAGQMLPKQLYVMALAMACCAVLALLSKILIAWTCTFNRSG
jgi:MFS transporter, DHA1 family, multidrug resistance protein